MYVSLGDASDTVEWFYSQIKASLMIIYVGGAVNDQELVEELLRSGPSLDVVSGRQILLIVFGTEGAILDRDRRAIDQGNNNFLVLPGTVHSSPNWEDWERQKLVRIDQLPRSALASVSARSQTVAHDLYDQLDLEAGSAPCVVLYLRQPRESIAVQTRGVATLRNLWSFLESLRTVADDLANLDSGISNVAARLQRLIYETPVAEAALSSAMNERNTCFERLDEQLGLVGEASVAEILADATRPVYELLGFRQDKLEGSKVAPDHADRLRVAACGEGVSLALRSADNAQRDWNRARARLQELEAQMEKLGQFELEVNLKGEELLTVEDRIREICSRYERRLLWRHRAKPMLEAARIVAGVSGTAKDVASLRSSIESLQSRD